MSRIISRQLPQTSSCDLFIQIEIKKSLFFSGAETRDNICKKKGKKKTFLLLTFAFILYCNDHQVLKVKNIGQNL
jgi:hypothetical protein